MDDDDTRKLIFLTALESAGVDNWEGYSFACEIYKGLLEEYGLEED